MFKVGDKNRVLLLGVSLEDQMEEVLGLRASFCHIRSVPV